MRPPLHVDFLKVIRFLSMGWFSWTCVGIFTCGLSVPRFKPSEMLTTWPWWLIPRVIWDKDWFAFVPSLRCGTWPLTRANPTVGPPMLDFARALQFLALKLWSIPGSWVVSSHSPSDDSLDCRKFSWPSWIPSGLCSVSPWRLFHRSLLCFPLCFGLVAYVGSMAPVLVKDNLTSFVQLPWRLFSFEHCWFQ